MLKRAFVRRNHYKELAASLQLKDFTMATTGPLYLGLDLSTQQLKACVYDLSVLQLHGSAGGNKVALNHFVGCL